MDEPQMLEQGVFFLCLSEGGPDLHLLHCVIPGTPADTLHDCTSSHEVHPIFAPKASLSEASENNGGVDAESLDVAQ